jgi:hypothetical protein
MDGTKKYGAEQIVNLLRRIARNRELYLEKRYAN